MMRRVPAIVALGIAVALEGCVAEPKALYFTQGEASDFAVCGKPAPAGDAISEFAANGRTYRMLWVKGTMCEFSDKGAFLQSYLWGATQQSATHVLVDRSGVLEEDYTFGPVATTATDEQIGRAAVIDAAALAGLIALVLLIWFWRTRRRSGQPSGTAATGQTTGPAIIVEDNIWPSLDVVRALGAGAVLGVTNGFPVNVVDPRRPEAEMKAMLGDTWYVFNADDLDHQFRSLLERGHSERFDWLIALSLGDVADGEDDAGVAAYFDEPSEFEESAANLGPAVEWLRGKGYITSDDDLRRGTIGYDIDRAVMLVRAALGAGYVARRTALSMVMYAGEHAQLRFDSWREFATSVLLGRAIWGGVDDPSGQFAERVAVVEMLLTDPTSPWLTAGWWPPRAEGDKDSDPRADFDRAMAEDEAADEDGDPPRTTLH